MKKLLICLAALTIATPAYAGNRMLVEFLTDSYDTTLVWLAQLEERGVTARYVFHREMT